MAYPLDILLSIAAFLFGVLISWLFFRTTVKSDYSEQNDTEANLYHQLFEQATDSIFIADFEGKILDINESGCLLLGDSKNEVINTHLSAYVDPEALLTDPLKYTSLSRGEHVFNERLMRKKDGSTVWVEVNVKKFAENRILGIARDITENKQIQADLMESELKFRDLAEKSMVGIYITQDGKFKYVNRRFAQIFGYSEQEMINSFPVETVIAEEDRHITIAHIKARMDGLTDSVHYQIRGCRKDGSKNFIEIFGNVTLYCGRTAIIGSLLDITDKKLADDQLIKEKSFSETIIRTLPGIFVVRNMAGSFLTWNQNFEKIIGYSESEILESKPYDYIIPRDRERVKAIVQDIHRDGSVASVETELIKKDGTTVPVFFSGTSFEWEGQQCVMATAIDISRRLEAERKLAISEQKYKLLFESNPLPMFMASKKDMAIIAANDAAVALYGYSKEELLNMTFKDLKPAEDIDQLVRFFNKPVPQIGDLGIRRNKKKDGSVIYVQVIGQDIEYLGKQVRLTLLKDVTAKLRAEEEIRRSRANLRSILNTTDVGYMLYNKDMKLVTFNPSAAAFAIRELKVELTKGIKITDFSSPEKLAELEHLVSELRAGTPFEFERPFEQPNNDFHWYQIRLFPVIDADKFLGIVASIEDITKRKKDVIHREKIAGDLLQRNKDLEQFTYIVSHNLRAPVANILGISSILKNEKLKNDARLHFESILSVSVEQLDSVIKDLNEILQAGRDVTEKKVYVDFDQLIGNIKTSIQTLLMDENVQILTDFDEVNGTTTLRTYIYSILYNLINNSIKFRKADEEPVIRISSHRLNDNIVLKIRDNGVGIDLTKHADEIFGLYNRLNTEMPGKGMGLYMVKTQVQLLGGTIKIESTPGIGTEFTIELPDSTS